MKSIFGLEQNLAAALSYVFAFFSGIAVLVMERENKFVRFHALQSTLWFLFLLILRWAISLLTGIPFLGWILGIVLFPLSIAIGIVGFASWILLMFKASQGEMFKIPIIGDVVWSQINK